MRVEAKLEVVSVEGNDVNEPGAPSASATERLPDPIAELAVSGDVGAMVAALVIQSGAADRRTHGAVRRSEEATQERAEAAQVRALHDKASNERMGAWASGLTTIGSGAISCASVDPHASAWAAKGADVASKVTSGLGKPLDDLYSSRAADRDADAKDAERDANAAKSRAADARDDGKAAQDLVNKALDFYKQYLQGKDQAMSAAIRRA